MLQGKIPEEVIKHWKDQLQGIPLYKYPIKDDQEVLFRLMNRVDMQSAREIIRKSNLENRDSQNEVNEHIWDRCVLWPELSPEDRLVVPIGYIWNVAKIVEERSGLLEVDIQGNILAPDRHSSCLVEPATWGDCVGTELEELKTKYKKAGLHRLRVSKWVFFVRPITRLDLSSARNSEDPELALLDNVTVWPNKIDWDSLPVGIIERLVTMANGISGWNDDGEAVEVV